MHAKLDSKKKVKLIKMRQFQVTKLGEFKKAGVGFVQEKNGGN